MKDGRNVNEGRTGGMTKDEGRKEGRTKDSGWKKRRKEGRTEEERPRMRGYGRREGKTDGRLRTEERSRMDGRKEG